MGKELLPPQKQRQREDPLAGELLSKKRTAPLSLIEQIEKFLQRQRKMKKEDSNPCVDEWRDELL